MEPENLKKLQAFFRKYQLVHFKKRQTLLRAGDTPSGVYYVERGFVRLYSVSESGKELTLVIYKPGDFFPVVWSFTQEPSIYYFETYSDVTVRKAPREEFLAFISRDPALFLDTVNPILLRFKSALRRMEYLVFGNAYAKVASIFRILAKHYGRVAGDETKILIPLTHRDIAALVGITREATSIEVQKLIKKGIITQKDHLFVIPSMERLRQEAMLE